MCLAANVSISVQFVPSKETPANKLFRVLEEWFKSESDESRNQKLEHDDANMNSCSTGSKTGQRRGGAAELNKQRWEKINRIFRQPTIENYGFSPGIDDLTTEVRIQSVPICQDSIFAQPVIPPHEKFGLNIRLRKSQPFLSRPSSSKK